MTGLGLAVAVVAVGLAAAALFVFGVAVASAAFFFVGIVAFRSVDTAAFVADVLVDFVVAAAFGVGLVEAVVLGVAAFRAAAVLRPAGALLVATLLAVLLAVVLGALLEAGLAFSSLGAGDRALGAAGFFATVRARAAVAGFPARAAVVARVALARFTEAAGCAALRAAALDAATGLAVRPDDFGAGFALVVTRALAEAVAAFEADGLAEADFVAVGFAAVGFLAVDLAATGLRTTVLAALRSRVAGLVLGDMCATPEIGRSPGA